MRMVYKRYDETIDCGYETMFMNSTEMQLLSVDEYASLTNKTTNYQACLALNVNCEIFYGYIGEYSTIDAETHFDIPPDYKHEIYKLIQKDNFEIFKNVILDRCEQNVKDIKSSINKTKFRLLNTKSESEKYEMLKQLKTNIEHLDGYNKILKML